MIVQGTPEDEQVLLDIRTGKVLVVNVEEGFCSVFDEPVPEGEEAIEKFRTNIVYGCGSVSVLENLKAFDDLVISLIKTVEAEQDCPMRFMTILEDVDTHLVPLWEINRYSPIPWPARWYQYRR